MTKRLFDMAAGTLGLLVLSPLLLLIAVVIRLDSPGPALFAQERVGRRFRRFRLLKFRTMVRDAQVRGLGLTVGEDSRITRVGRVLRRTKVDELPQLINVVRGEMSLVGPRPEMERYVEMFRRDFEEILCVKPGMTSPASIRYREEAALLAAASDPEEYYVRTVLPDKLAMAREYVAHASVALDVSVIVRTLAALLGFPVSA